MTNTNTQIINGGIRWIMLIAKPHTALAVFYLIIIFFFTIPTCQCPSICSMRNVSQCGNPDFSESERKWEKNNRSFDRTPLQYFIKSNWLWFCACNGLKWVFEKDRDVFPFSSFQGKTNNLQHKDEGKKTIWCDHRTDVLDFFFVFKTELLKQNLWWPVTISALSGACLSFYSCVTLWLMHQWKWDLLLLLRCLGKVIAYRTGLIIAPHTAANAQTQPCS